MRILMIGGTRFIGRHVVSAASDRGHQVTIFHRGRTGADLFPDVEHRIGDRNEDLSALAEGEWDATVDTCAYYPRQVQELADALGGRGGHHLLVSSVSAYAPADGPGTTEDGPLAELDDPTVEEVTDQTYGGLKVLCERAAVERHGPSTVLVRPTYVVGPDDYTWRFPWWVARIARGGEVLVPEPKDVPAQVIDVRDMAGWMVSLLENGHSGAYHAVSPPPGFTWQQQIEAIAQAVGPPGTTLTWMSDEAVRAAGLPEGTFPLWSGDDPDVWLMACDPSKAVATGLTPRDLGDTIRDTLAWTRTVDQPDGAGLDPQAEKELLAAWHSR
ncbi:MAG TPA: NAD-dependent epimerase/dehydratase family protein [Actinomycetes bacterium]|jgi:2'-hydroxyisoflavone reductase|nr:NAD-dependent epimerase/dehydratase family protein [Actinomycetes bacterium]